MEERFEHDDAVVAATPRPRPGGSRRRAVAVALTALLALVTLLAGCGQEQGSNTDPDQVDAVTAPKVGVCRQLEPADLRLPVNASRTVSCSGRHTAVTIAVGEVPGSLAEDGPDSPALIGWASRTCTRQFASHVGAEESTGMRTVLGWTWFRPSQKAWDDGARWYRCDLVGGSADSPALLRLPAQTRGLLAGVPGDDWMACARGTSVQRGSKVPCTRTHDWRAVSTIKLGEPRDPYPGDDVSQRRTRQFCADSVAAWLRYPASYDYAFTWFGQEEWERGNRRAICWAKTTH